MKTLLRRLSLAAAGFAMALGVGVAIGNTPKVVETQATETRTYFEHSGAIVEGNYVLCYNGKAMKASIASDRFQYTEVTPSDGKLIIEEDSSLVWHIAQSNAYWTIYNESVGKYAAGNGKANQGALLESGSDDGSLWTASGSGAYNFVNKQNATNSVNAYLRNNGSHGFACYAEGTGGPLSLYKEVTISAVSSLSATITAPQGDEEWTITDVVLTGTLNGVADQDISDYVDLVPVTDVPRTTSDSYPVTIGFSRKSGVLGNTDLGTQVVDATVTEDVFMNYRPVKSVSALNTYTLYALGYADKTKFINTSYASVETDTAIELLRLEPCPKPNEDKFYLRIVTGSSYPYTNGKYVNNSSSATVSYGDTASAVWQPNEADGLVNLLNTTNENRWLSNYLKDPSNYLGAYKSNQANTTKVYLYSAPTDVLTSVEAVGQTVLYDAGEEFQRDAKINATYSISGTEGHTNLDATKGDKIGYEFKGPNAAEFSRDLPAEIGFEHNGGTVRVTYTDAWGASASTTYVIRVRLNSILDSETSDLSNFLSGATITETGTYGSGARATAIQDGFLVTSDKGYFQANDCRIYEGGDLCIRSTVGHRISSIGFTFNGNTGGLEPVYSSINATEITWQNLKRADITGIHITYYAEYANNNDVAQDAVIEFASFLNNTMAVDGVCGTSPANYGVHENAVLNTAWNNVKAKYNDLFGSGEHALTGDDLAHAKKMLALATAKWDDSPDCLQRAMKTYDFVISHYSSALGSGYNFLSDAGRNPANRIQSPYVTNESLNPAILVALLGGLSVALVGGYFFLRHRREQE